MSQGSPNDPDIQLLDDAIDAFNLEHPESYGLIRLNRTSLMAATAPKWEAHGWDSITKQEVEDTLSGNEGRREKGLLSLLKEFRVRKIE